MPSLILDSAYSVNRFAQSAFSPLIETLFFKLKITARPIEMNDYCIVHIDL